MYGSDQIKTDEWFLNRSEYNHNARNLVEYENIDVMFAGYACKNKLFFIKNSNGFIVWFFFID